MSRQGGKLSSVFVAHDPVDVVFDEPSRTRQEFADECDINVLMQKFEATGVVSHVEQRQPMYLDVSEGVLPLREAIDTVRAANEAFMTLPARARAEFDNDPIRFVEFARDPKNGAKMVEWGLAQVREAPPVVKVEVTNPPAASPGSSQG